jgi:predicted nuclease with TOPRIM domain
MNYINEYDSDLEKRYLELREKYRDRFDGFTYSELIKEYYKITGRINDLEKRLDKVKKIDGKVRKIYHKKKNRAEYLIWDIEEELYRRERAFEDLETEFIRDRGIDIEAMVVLDNFVD